MIPTGNRVIRTIVRRPPLVRARPMAGHAFAVLIWTLAAFIGFQCLFSWIIDRWEPGLRDQEYGRKLSLLRAQVTEHPHRPLVLALGTSRTVYGLRPGAISSVNAQQVPSETEPLVFNFGVLGGGPFYELVYLNRLLDEGIVPTTVLIEVHPPLLHDVPDLSFVLAPVVERCDARDLAVLRRFTASPIKLYAQWLRLRIATCHRYRYALISRAASMVVGNAATRSSGLDSNRPARLGSLSLGSAERFCTARAKPSDGGGLRVRTSRLRDFRRARSRPARNARGLPQQANRRCAGDHARGK